jgi:hypothetical protein
VIPAAYGVVDSAAVKMASKCFLSSSFATAARYCVHASPNAPPVDSGVVFHGHAPLKYVVRCHPSFSAMPWNVVSS